MRIAYETPMVVEGVPPRRSRKRIICKRVGQFDLREFGAHEVRPVVNVRPVRYHADGAIELVSAGAAGTFRSVMPLSRGTFEVAGGLPSIRERYEEIARRVRDVPKLELERAYHPPDLAVLMSKKSAEAARQLREIRSREIRDLDMEKFDGDHAKLLAELGGYMTSGGMVYREAHVPFVALQIQWETVTAEVVRNRPLARFVAEKRPLAVFGMTQLDAAAEAATEASYALGLGKPDIHAYEVDLFEPEMLTVDQSEWALRCLAERVKGNFVDHLSSIGNERTALEVPFDAFTLVRALDAAIKAGDLGGIEDAVEDCLEADRISAADSLPLRFGRFDASRVEWMVRRAADRPINIDIGGTAERTLGISS